MIDQLSQALQVAFTTAGIYMVLMYFLSIVRKNTGVVDVAWGMGFFTVALALDRVRTGDSDLFSFVHVLVAIWGIRLFLHILFRHVGKPEDWRYANWRKQWGKNHWWRSFLQVFMLQGILLVVIAAPLLAAVTEEDGTIQPIAWIGAAIWLVGFFFEAVGDFQLRGFLRRKAQNEATMSKAELKKQPRFMTEGVWKYTRHPNYFGEVTMWWGLWVMVLSTQYGWLAIVSPLTITFLLLKVSGIPMLEERWAKDKEFKKYKKRTSAFFPTLPRG